MHGKLTFVAATLMVALLAGCQPSTSPAPKATAPLQNGQSVK